MNVSEISPVYFKLVFEYFTHAFYSLFLPYDGNSWLCAASCLARLFLGDALF